VRPLRTERPDLPASGEAAVLRAIAVQPEDRFASAADFRAALRAH